MNDSNSEEKTEEPTPRKLRKAREKGQVATSKDVVTTVLTLGVFIYFWVSWGYMSEQLASILVIPGQLLPRPFDEVVWEGISAMLSIAGTILLPIILLVVGLVIVAHIVVLKGFVFAVEPLIPRADKISPSKGFKRIFSRKSVVEFAKSLVKTIVLGAIGYVVIKSSLSDLVQLSSCDPLCTAAALAKVMILLILTISVFYIIVGFIDYFLQVALFRHEMRMTRTELKREVKDREGDPMIRGRRRQMGREMILGNALEGMQHATVALRGVGATVGIHFVQGSTPLPILVAKGRGQQSGELLNVAIRAGIPINDDTGLVNRLLTEVPAGSPIADQELLGLVAPHLAN